MPATRDQLHQWSNSIFLVTNNVPEPQRTSCHTILYLVSPEDTTKIEGADLSQTVHGGTGNVLGVVKTLFWIAVSLTLSLLVGQLH